MSTATTTVPRLKAQVQRRDPGPALKADLELGNIMQVPRLEKIVVNWASARPSASKSLLDGAVDRPRPLITGQKPVVTKAKKSIAGFKLREGNAIGAKVTLRGDRMWEFFDRLVSAGDPPHPRLPRASTRRVVRRPRATTRSA